MSFVELPVEQDPEAMIESGFEDLETALPGWKPNAGNPETWLMRAMVTRLTSPLAILAGDVGAEIFYRFGEDIVKVQPIEAVAATVTSTWKATDTAGYSIEAGTQVSVATSGDESVGFVVTTEVKIAPGSNETAAGAVVLQAVVPGTVGNTRTGTATVVNALPWVSSITLVGESSGGLDAETPDEYLDRLTDTMTTLAPRPILARDVEILARNVPGVYRAVVMDLYNPATDEAENTATWDSEKAASVAAVDAAGVKISTPVKELLDKELQAKREVNFIFTVIDPTSTEIDVTYQVVPLAGYSQAEANASAKAAIEAWLSPAVWGTVSNQGIVVPRSWTNQRTLRFQDLVTVINTAVGVDYYTELKFAETGKTLEQKDVNLKGAACLPKAKTIKVGP